MIGKTEDEIERQKRLVIGGTAAKQGLTIYEYYWELNELLKPKKTPPTPER